MTPSQVLISTATPSSFAELLALDGRCFDRPWSQNAWQREFDRSFCEIQLLEIAGECLGYCVCWYLAPQAELLRIAIAPEQRGRGLGQRLLAAGLSRMAARDCESMSLEVQADNAAAIALYEKSNFRIVGRRPGYYDGRDGLLMQWTK